MSNLNIWQETKPVTGANVLVAAIFKDSAPTVLIAIYQFPTPYTGQTQLKTFTGLASVLYNYKLYESPDGSPSGTIRTKFDVQPNSNVYNTRDPLFLQANTDPFITSGTNFYGPDPSLIGWNWSLESVGVGTLRPGVDYVKTIGGVPTTQDDINADGWQMLATGYLIQDQEKFVIHFLPQLQASMTSQASALISSTLLLTSTTTLTNSAAGQSFLLQGGVGYFQINLPDINTVPDNVPIFFDSSGGSHINVGIAAAAGQLFQFYKNMSDLSSNTLCQKLYMGQCESGYIYKFTFPDNSKKWLVFGFDACRTVGETAYSYSRLGLNTLFANGQLLSRANYSRLWEWVNTLESGMVISDSAYNNTSVINGILCDINLAKYTTGDGSTSFRVPTLWSYGYTRAKSGIAGSLSFNGQASDFTPQSIGTHDHATHGKGVIADSGSRPPSPTWFLSIGNGSYSGPGGNLLGRSSSPDTTMRTSDNNNSFGGENSPAATGTYASIRF